MSKILLVAMLAASAFDVGTTEVGLARGGAELNPLMRSRAVRVTVNVAVPVGLYKVIRGRPVKTQLAIAGPYVGFKTFLGARNLAIARKLKETAR